MVTFSSIFRVFSEPSFLVTCVLVSLCLYLWTFNQWHYWKVRGVPFLKPVLPVFGNMYDIVFLRSLVDIAHRIYEETKGLPFVGIYAFHTPVFFVSDLDLIAKILVNDFNHFEDRGFHSNISDTLGRNLIHQTGPDWKYSRSKLAPCFNIKKVKSMLPMMLEKSKALVDKIEKDQSTKQVIDAWDLSLRFSMDVVALYNMGIDINTIHDKNEIFSEAGSDILGLHFIYHVFVGCFFPRLHKYLGISVAKSKVKTFFHDVLNQIITYRKDRNHNEDVVHTLLQLKNDPTDISRQIPEIDDNFIVAQTFIFFLAGFESPGNILACTLYEIAKQPDIQEALYLEMKSVLERNNNKITFEALQDMKYHRQVVSESLRKYTPLTLIFRRCTKDYTIPGTSTVIEKGTLVLVPLRSIHEDSDLYPNPKEFNPGRFSDESTASRHIAAYMPFGVGPRFCPAVLYSHIKIRAALVYILQNFEICLSETTPPQLEPSALNFLFTPKNGVPLFFRRRGF